MSPSRSLSDSGGHLAQLIMIACLLGTPSLNAIPLQSLSSIPNQHSHIHSIPHLSKRMEISSLGTLGVGAKNAHTAPDLVNAEHAEAALQKSSSAQGVNKADAPGAGVFPLTHTDEENDSDDIFYDVADDFGQDKNGQIIPIDSSPSSPHHSLKSLNTLPQQHGTTPLTPDLVTENKLFDLKNPQSSKYNSPPTTHYTASGHANSDVPITPLPPKVSEEAKPIVLRYILPAFQEWREELIAQGAKHKQLDVKYATQTTIAQPRNVRPTAKAHPSAEGKESPPVQESELRSQHSTSKDQHGNPLGKKAANSF